MKQVYRITVARKAIETVDIDVVASDEESAEQQAIAEVKNCPHKLEWIHIGTFDDLWADDAEILKPARK